MSNPVQSMLSEKLFFFQTGSFLDAKGRGGGTSPTYHTFNSSTEGEHGLYIQD